MLVRVPDGRVVDFGDTPREEIKRQIANKFPNWQRQQAGVAGVPGGLGAPPSGTSLSDVGGYLQPQKPSLGDVRGGYTGDPGIPLPRTTQDLQEQLGAPGGDLAAAGQAVQKVAEKANVPTDDGEPVDPTNVMSIGRSMTPKEVPWSQPSALPAWLLYRGLPAVTEAAQDIASRIGGPAPELTEYALTGAPELHSQFEARKVATDIHQAYLSPEMKPAAKAVLNYLNEQAKVAPEVQKIKDKAVDAGDKGQPRRQKALQDVAEIKRQEIAGELPKSPPPPPPREGPPPTLPPGRTVTAEDVATSRRKAEEARKAGDNNRAAAHEDIARKQQEELDKLKKREEFMNEQPPQDDQSEEAARKLAVHWLNRGDNNRATIWEEVAKRRAQLPKDSFYLGSDLIKPLETHKAADYLRKLDITPLMKSEVTRKLMPFFKEQVLKILGDVPLHILTDEDMIKFMNNRPGQWGGGWNQPLNRMALNSKYIHEAPEIVLHEALHAATTKAIGANPVLRKAIDTLRSISRVHPSMQNSRKWAYAHSNADEFVAHAFSNRAFQDLLAQIPVSKEVIKQLNLPKPKRSVWDAMVTAVRKVIGKLPDNGQSMVEALMRPVQQAIAESHPTVDGMMRGNSWRDPVMDQTLGALQFFSNRAAQMRTAVAKMNRLSKTFSPTARSKTGPYYGSQTRTAEIFRKFFGLESRITAKDEAKMEEFHKEFNKIPGGYGNDPAPPGYTGDTKLDWMRRMQGTRKTPLKDPALEHAATVVKKIYADVRRDFSNRPSWAHLSWIDDYLTQNWKETPAMRNFQQRLRTAYSGRTGTGRYLKQRKFPTVDDALNAGLEPKYDDPLDMVLQYDESMRRHLAKWNTYDLLKDEGRIQWFYRDNAPPGYEALENGGPVKERNFITEPNSGKRAYMLEDEAKIWNNVMSPSISHYNEKLGNFLDHVRMAENAFTRSVLAWPAFHAMTVSLSAISSHVALALDNTILALAKGEKVQWKMGAQQLVEAAGAPIFYTMQGRKLNRQFARLSNYGAAFEKIADLASRANFKTRAANIEWASTGAGTFWKAYQRGALRKQLKAYGTEIPKFALTGHPLKALAMTGELVGRTVDSTFDVLWNKYIPNLKMGAFYYNMKAFMERNPMASEAELERAARGFADSMDNRFGQLQNDNLFWKNTHRQVAQLTFLSASWQMAYLREAGGALGDIAKFVATRDPKHLSTRVSYMISASVVTAVSGGIANMLFTGQMPQSLKDLFWPRTGGKNPDGSDERIMLPGHEKDINEMVEIAQSGFSPSVIRRVISGKISPFALFAYQTYMGEDYRGFPINPTNDTESLIGRTLENIETNLTPIPLQQSQLARTKGSGLGAGSAMLGIRKAPMGASEPGLAEYIDVNQRFNQAVRKRQSDMRRQHSLQDPHSMDAELKRDMQDIQELIKQRKAAWDKYQKDKKPQGYQGTVAPQQ